MYIYKNILQPVDFLSGLSQELLIAPVDVFTKIAQPTPDGYNFSKEVIISDSHQFIDTSEGFIRIRLAPQKSSVQAKDIGDFAAHKFESTYVAQILGSDPELHGFMSIIHNREVIALIRDANCAAGQYYQLGVERRPAQIVGDWTSGNEKDGMKGYNISITSINNCILVYNGDIKAYGNTCKRFTCEFDCEFY